MTKKPLDQEPLPWEDEGPWWFRLATGLATLVTVSVVGISLGGLIALCTWSWTPLTGVTLPLILVATVLAFMFPSQVAENVFHFWRGVVSFFHG